MSKVFLVFFLITSAILLFAFINKKGDPSSSIHQFKAKTLEGEDFDFAQLKGKKILIVNTASKCGFTPQYKELETLYQQYKDKNFTIIGFPCNQFGEQEPGTSSEIHDFCSKNYGVTFLMMEKVNVKGDSICDIYKWLTKKSQNGVMSSSVKWNFQKYMIDGNGYLVDYVLPFKSPLNSKITKWIERQN